jgi:hypothetical protein
MVEVYGGCYGNKSRRFTGYYSIGAGFLFEININF